MGTDCGRDKATERRRETDMERQLKSHLRSGMSDRRDAGKVGMEVVC